MKEFKIVRRTPGDFWVYKRGLFFGGWRVLRFSDPQGTSSYPARYSTYSEACQCVNRQGIHIAEYVECVNTIVGATE